MGQHVNLITDAMYEWHSTNKFGTWGLHVEWFEGSASTCLHSSQRKFLNDLHDHKEHTLCGIMTITVWYARRFSKDELHREALDVLGTC